MRDQQPIREKETDESTLPELLPSRDTNIDDSSLVPPPLPRRELMNSLTGNNMHSGEVTGEEEHNGGQPFSSFVSAADLSNSNSIVDSSSEFETDFLSSEHSDSREVPSSMTQEDTYDSESPSCSSSSSSSSHKSAEQSATQIQISSSIHHNTSPEEREHSFEQPVPSVIHATTQMADSETQLVAVEQFCDNSSPIRPTISKTRSGMGMGEVDEMDRSAASTFTHTTLDTLTSPIVSTERSIPRITNGPQQLPQTQEGSRDIVVSSDANGDIIISNPRNERTHQRRQHTNTQKGLLSKPKSFLEKVFGCRRSQSEDVNIAASPECIRRRDVLKWTVKQNFAVPDHWITSIQTNQKAVESNDHGELSRSIKNFSASSQQHATELGLALATPIKLPFDENPFCYICKTKFAIVRRRPRHCRNCGICICSSCSVTWPAKMIPETYNIKGNKFRINVCLGCNWLSTMFREALMNGNFEDATNLYSTGNVNLRTPLINDNKGEEILYPIHAAAMSGNLSLVKWLTIDHCCPLQDPAITLPSRNCFKRKTKEGGPILTSKGRSVLGIAMEQQNVEMISFFVRENYMSFHEEKNLGVATMANLCTTLISILPPANSQQEPEETKGTTARQAYRMITNSPHNNNEMGFATLMAC